jgi:flagellar assembly factor FliW
MLQFRRKSNRTLRMLMQMEQSTDRYLAMVLVDPVIWWPLIVPSVMKIQLTLCSTCVVTCACVMTVQ